MLHELIIPDELLDWGKEQALKAGWRRSWAHEAERLIRMAEERPLGTRATEALLARLEGLVVAATAAGRDHLLVGFDMFTAEWLGLHYTIELSDTESVTVGCGGSWDYQELRALLATEAPVEALVAAKKAKQLVAEVFEGSRVERVSTRAEAEVGGECTECGQGLATVVLALERGSQYCAPCWSRLTDSRPVDLKRKPTPKRS